MQASPRALFAILASLLLLALSGCAPQPITKPAPGTSTAATEAAVLSRDSDYLLATAEALAAAGDLAGLDEVLTDLSRLPLTAGQAIRLAQLKAERLLQLGQPLAALDALGPLPPADPDLGRRHHDIAARAYRLSGNMLQSATELLALDELQSTPASRLITQKALLHTLALLSDAALTRLQPSPPGILGGWMDLALTLKRHGQEPAGLNRALADWRLAHPLHPALPGLLDGMVVKLQSQYQRAAHIAILLPESGPYAGAAAAIRDGILAAWYQQPADQRPLLRFYDASDSTRAWPLLGEAIAAGAEAVIGPLDKDSVRQLARAGELAAPVLALNQIPLDARPPQNFYQFALSPEDEAHQVAEKAWLDGHRYPVVLAPGNEWGQRVADAFERRWLSLGGRLAGQQAYSATDNDFGQPIRRLLHLDQSTARNRQLERLLGQNLKFEPRRRGDADFVFMAAQGKQARQLRPQLQFHHAADLPVYATSHAWDGQPDNQNEALDLAGIQLPDMPWILDADTDSPLSRDRLKTFFPASGSAYGRLYAMGIDSLHLLPHLQRLQSAIYETLDGQTGSLHMDALGQVHRQLVWTRLTRSGNKVMGFAPRLDMPGSEILLEPPPPSTAPGDRQVPAS